MTRIISQLSPYRTHQERKMTMLQRMECLSPVYFLPFLAAFTFTDESCTGLRLRGLLLASSSFETISSDSSSDHQNTVEDSNSRTPRPSPRRDSLSQSHPIFRPEKIDGLSSPTIQRHRATTLPTSRDRNLPSLPRLTIPGTRDENARMKESSKGPGELLVSFHTLIHGIVPR